LAKVLDVARQAVTRKIGNRETISFEAFERDMKKEIIDHRKIAQLWSILKAEYEKSHKPTDKDEIPVAYLLTREEIADPTLWTHLYQWQKAYAERIRK
jgi:hypothetical protein